MRITAYDNAWRKAWDDFVLASKNGTFLFMRGYMEYHADRFTDSSLIVTGEGDRIVALLPANRTGDTIVSHGGLTYGGFVTDTRMSGVDILGVFSLLREYLSDCGVRRMIYKPVPSIYHRQPSDEDLYALFRNDARLAVRNLSTTINLRDPIPSSRLMKRAVKRQRRYGIKVDEVEVADSFWSIVVEDRRVRHNVRPVHTASELNYLKSLFPENIRFYTATSGDKVLGGAVIYLDRGVIHLQYAACTPEGKDMYATDVIYHELINERLAGNNYFDFGISNEDAGRYLNEGMVRHKEEFGGRSIIYDAYEVFF